MDLRVKKTETAIKNAFLELRAKKPLEKITVKNCAVLPVLTSQLFILTMKIFTHCQKPWNTRQSCPLLTVFLI